MLARVRNLAAIAALAASIAACSSNDPASSPAGADAGADAEVPKIPMPTGDMLSWAVDQVGPFMVGYRRWEISYTPPGQTKPRTIGLNVWYPSLDAEGTPPKYVGIFTDDDVFEDASLAPPIDGKSYPVHVHSHGSSGFGGTSSFLAHHFASHGWVFAAPDHTDNTLGSPEGKDRPVALWYERSTDVTATLDALEKLDAADPLAGKLRTDRVVMSGHSFGTLTTWASGGAPFDVDVVKAKCDAGDFTKGCTADEIAAFGKGFVDPRVVAAIPMAGGFSDFFVTGAYDAPKIPFLLMTGTKDVSGQGIFDVVTKTDLTWLEFVGGCHQLFALGGCPEFEEQLGWKLVETWALAFARKHVLADPSDRTRKILSGEEVLSDKIIRHEKGAAAAP